MSSRTKYRLPNHTQWEHSSVTKLEMLGSRNGLRNRSPIKSKDSRYYPIISTRLNIFRPDPGDGITLTIKNFSKEEGGGRTLQGSNIEHNQETLSNFLEVIRISTALGKGPTQSLPLRTHVRPPKHKRREPQLPKLLIENYSKYIENPRT